MPPKGRFFFLASVSKSYYSLYASDLMPFEVPVVV
jgi:hypothetical protein